MRHLDIVDQWYKEIDKRFPDFSEELKKELAVCIYDELDYIIMMGSLRPGGLFEKMNIPCPESKPAGVIDATFLKYFQ